MTIEIPNHEASMKARVPWPETKTMVRYGDVIASWEHPPFLRMAASDEYWQLTGAQSKIPHVWQGPRKRSTVPKCRLANDIRTRQVNE